MTLLMRQGVSLSAVVDGWSVDGHPQRFSFFSISLSLSMGSPIHCERLLRAPSLSLDRAPAEENEAGDRSSNDGDEIWNHTVSCQREKEGRYSETSRNERNGQSVIQSSAKTLRERTCVFYTIFSFITLTIFQKSELKNSLT